MLQRPYILWPVWFKATHALVVCMLVLGTLRALIPGLCATLSAQADSCETEVASCCAARMAEEAALPAFRAPREGKEHPPCAFCHLVLGLGQSDVVQPIIIAVTPAIGGAFLAPITPCAATLAAANGSRAPPTSA